MIFPEILGNPAEIELLYQEKEFVELNAREMSSSATIAERREVHASRLLLCMRCCAGVQPRLLSAICIHLAYRYDVESRNRKFPRIVSKSEVNFSQISIFVQFFNVFPDTRAQHLYELLISRFD